MPSESVRELAREYPEAFKKVAQARDDTLQDILMGTLREEQ